MLCLRTKSSGQAQQTSIAVLAKLEDYWLKLRIKDLDVPASHLLNESLSVTGGMPTIEDTLNKRIKQVAGFDNVIHGFRHSFKDRLRAVSAPSDMIDQLGGWSLQSVGQVYGEGYSVDIRAT